MLDVDSTIIYNGDMTSDHHKKGATMPEEFYTPEELAGYLKISPQTVRAWIREKKVHAVKLGRGWRVPVDEVRRVATEGVDEE
jgi:excisionase family DNA binding protein